ncbi:PX domain-containing protein [Podospora didyma]|uniref:Endosomal/vacuolar adapter protein YPT35 n=1 Tax=Podospora didyma TaxID=330526 RepID=A0AAE0P726_9PEZI|nr:PX domain-containing protein [Podospora didyma]
MATEFSKYEERNGDSSSGALNGPNRHHNGLSSKNVPLNNGEGDPTLFQQQLRQSRLSLFLDGDQGSDSPESDKSDNDDVSEAVTSPSITSPPYWAHSHSQALQQAGGAGAGGPHGGHTRSVSNVSVESVLAPGAITLQDNEQEDGTSSRNVYGRDRNRACWAKSVEITDSVMVNGSTTNIGAFVVWNIRVETLNGSYMNIRKRYSEFDDLRRRLVQTFPNFEAAVPVLPPKSVMSKFRPRFLEKRRAGLQYFLNCILLNPEFSASPVLKEFLFA